MMTTDLAKQLLEAIKQLEAAVKHEKAAGMVTARMVELVRQIRDACKSLDEHLKE